jgi:hypothetical protein
MTLHDSTAFPNSLPHPPFHPHESPMVSLSGLLDLLDALEDQLACAPGIIPLLSNTLRDELEEVADYGG